MKWDNTLLLTALDEWHVRILGERKLLLIAIFTRTNNEKECSNPYPLTLKALDNSLKAITVH